MMIIFLLIYVLFFFVALYGLFRGNTDRILLFIIFGLPIYFTSLSVAYVSGFANFIPLLQAFKEIIILAALCVLLYHRKTKIRFHLLDWLVTAYFVYTFIYVLIPLGNFGFSDRLLAFKSTSFFPLVYFAGRLTEVHKINFNRYFSYICIVSILAGCVMVIEVVRYEHLQVYTGYSEFNRFFLNQDTGGSYGLSWTFETPHGLKRFASFYSMPLEMGVNTICTIAVLIALSTKDNNKFKPNILILTTLLFTVFSIFNALSRASFASYFLIVYVYAMITNKRKMINAYHYTGVAIVIIFLFLLEGDIYEWIANTIDFSDSSSAFHIVQWLDGLQAISSHPLGLGLGMSGRVAISTDSNIGGENQLIIIGVQAGLIAVALYIAIYIYTIRTCVNLFKKTKEIFDPQNIFNPGKKVGGTMEYFESHITRS